MNRQQYMKELSHGLRSLPENDRGDAIAYYNEYFDEVGPAGEEDLIQNLGNPKKGAAGIVAQAQFKEMDTMNTTPKKGFSALWTVILIAFASPIALPLIIAFVVVLLAFAIAIAAILFSFFVGAIAMVISGVAGILMSIIILPASFVTAAFSVACGLVVLGLGILSFLGTQALSRWIIEKVSNLARKMIERRKQK